MRPIHVCSIIILSLALSSLTARAEETRLNDLIGYYSVIERNGVAMNDPCKQVIISRQDDGLIVDANGKTLQGISIDVLNYTYNPKDKSCVGTQGDGIGESFRLPDAISTYSTVAKARTFFMDQTLFEPTGTPGEKPHAVVSLQALSIVDKGNGTYTLSGHWKIANGGGPGFVQVVFKK